jgi:hypothetical protein
MAEVLRLWCIWKLEEMWRYVNRLLHSCASFLISGFFKGLATVVFISAGMNVFEMDGKNIKPPMTVGKSDTCSSESIYR